MHDCSRLDGGMEGVGVALHYKAKFESNGVR